MATSSLPALQESISAALAEPGLEEALLRDPPRAQALIESARDIAARAFDDEDPGALEQAHRTLYVLYEQSAFSPLRAARDSQHEPTMQSVLRVLERGFERWLNRFELPEEPPSAVDEFAPWLADLALERELPQLPPSGFGPWMREHATLDQMREVVAQRSLFFLKEPDPWAMVIPSLRGPAKAGLLDLLLDEYGWGRHDHMHSTVYERLMEQLGLDTGYDAYFEHASWQYLASLNLQGMYARHRRLCRRMYGYIYLIEADSPRSMVNYIDAYRRLGLDHEDVLRFYELHITADEGHQDVALNEVIVPVVRDEPAAAAEVARGVLEGHAVHSLFSRHLKDCFGDGRSSLRRPL